MHTGTVRRPSAFTSPEDELHEIRLVDDPAEPEPPRRRWPDCFKSSFHELMFFVFSGLVLSSCVVLHRATANMSNLIKLDLHMTTPRMAWVIGGSGITAAVFVLPLTYTCEGWVSSTRRFLLIGSLGLYALLAGLLSVSANRTAFGFLSVGCGATSAFHVSITSAMITSAYSACLRREAYLHAYAASASTTFGFAIGTAGAGAVGTKFGWRTAYIFIGVLFALVTLLGIYAIPRAPRRDLDTDVSTLQPARGTFKFMHWVNTFTILVGLCFVTLAFSLAADSSGVWGSPPIVVTMVIGISSLLAYGYSAYAPNSSLLPRSIWLSRNTGLVILFTFTSSMVFFSTLFWLSLFLQTFQYWTPIQVAVQLLPQQAASILVGNPLTYRLLLRVPVTAVLASSAILQLGGSIFLIFLRRESNYFSVVLPSLVLVSLGIELAWIISSQYALFAIPLEHRSMGAALMRSTVPAAASVALAILSLASIPAATAGPDASNSSDPSRPIMRIFITTTLFAALSLIFAIFTKIGRPDILTPSTDPPFNPVQASSPFSHSRDPSSAEKSHVEEHRSSTTQDSAAPGSDSHGAGVWRGAQIGPRSSSLLGNLGGILSRPTADDTHVSTPPPAEAAATTPQPTSQQQQQQQQQQQRSSTLTAERVIWLVCEDCGSSRRMVEPAGDPKRYFYDDEEGTAADRCAARSGAAGCRRVVPGGDGVSGRGGSDVAGRRFPLGTV